MVLKGLHAVITGASQGLGAQIAAHFVEAGASVMLCARDEASVQAMRDRLAAKAGPGQKILAMPCDVSDAKSCEVLIAKTLSQFPHIDVLVNNAGVQGPMGPLEELDWNEWVATVHTNLMGVVALCRAVLPGMKARRQGRIIALSGGGATNPMPRMTAYAASKAAVVRFTESLALEVREFGIDVNAVAPGALATRMLDQVLAAGPERVGHDYFKKMQGFREKGGMPIDAGARCCVWLASDASKGITGKLVAAQWDPYEDFPAHAADLDGGDIYALRRITPKDRGKSWGND